VVIACLALVPALSACGNNSESAPVAAGANILTSSELSAHPEGTVERAFLDFWSALQYQSWAEVAAYYSADFRDFVGTARLIDAKTQNASTFPLIKPEIVGVEEGDQTITLAYTLRFADGTKERASTTWQRNDGSWEMIYDSRLNPELVQLARNRMEIKLTGALPTDAAQPASPAAARAGERAGRIQGRFLEQELKAENP
jgi:hypothetical protein